MGVTNVNEVEYPVPQAVVGRGALFVEHRLQTPQVSESAYIAPTAVLAGDVTVGPHSRVLFGAVITAEGGPVEIGRNCVVMENAVVRACQVRKCVSVTGYSLARTRTSLAA
jgi:carbonic anhydrase/acetyltransferase-like protein (isoleucine patch superfamily)